MRAIILAAGRGSRMKSMTDHNPKGLVALCGKALVDYQLDALRGNGIDDIAIVTGYLSEQYQTRANTLFHNPAWQNTNMVASLMCGRELLLQDSCVISYSDIIYSAQAVDALIKTDGDIVITYDPKWRALWEARFENPLDDCETFLQDHSGNLLEIGGKPHTLDEVKGQYTGLFKITPAGWKIIEDILNTKNSTEIAKLDMTSLLQLIIKSGAQITCCPMRGQWGEVDEESDLILYEGWIRSGSMSFQS